MRSVFKFGLMVWALLLTLPAQAAPLMDLVDIEGIRANQVVGYGLVVGLDGSGDKNQVKFTSQSVANLIKQFGINLPPNVDPKLKNVAAVMVTATIPPSYSAGQTVDVTVSSLGDAKSLRGGQLLMTPLMGVDGEVYALAQGALVVGGVTASGRSGSSIAINSSNTGLIANGGTVERMIPSDFNERSDVMLNLRKPSFQTASRVAEAVNARFGSGSATALSGTKVSVTAPISGNQRISYMAILETLDVQEGRTRPKVVFNSRTGTVVVGQGVRVKAAAVAHGTLTVTISETPQVSQPGAFSGGQTAVVPRSDIGVSQQRNPMFAWPDGAELDSIIKTVKSLKTAPNDPATRDLLKSTLEQLDLTHGRVMGAITDLGGRQNTLTLLGNGNADVSLVNQKIQGDLSQLDLGGAFLQVSGYELAMQASQKVYTRVAAVSLFDLM